MGRTIVITGGGTGIGRAIAVAFAEDGDHVVVTGRRPGPLAETVETVASLSGSARSLPFDAADPAAVDAALPQLPDSIDVLVNNAGGNPDFDRPAPEGLAAIVASWQANLAANLITAVAVTSALRDRLAPGGAVVSIGSLAADRGLGGYGAAKAALASWNVQLAHELGPVDVTANVVAPGMTEDTEFFRDRLTDDRRADRIAETLTGRPSRPEDVAGVVHFLASYAARQVTGQVINVNGGARTTR
jgi:3-oxoacyl-[acyl-carrier protein] reductase